MRVNGHRHIAGQCCHFDGEHSFGNQFAGTDANNADTEDALCMRINDQLCHSFRSIESDSPSGCGPRKLRNFDFPILLFRLSFGETAPGNLRIGKNDCRDRVGLEGAFMSSDSFDRDSSLVRSLVRPT